MRILSLRCLVRSVPAIPVLERETAQMAQIDPFKVYQGLCIIALGALYQSVVFTIRAFDEGMRGCSILPMPPWLPSHIPKSEEGLLSAA